MEADFGKSKKYTSVDESCGNVKVKKDDLGENIYVVLVVYVYM